MNRFNVVDLKAMCLTAREHDIHFLCNIPSQALRAIFLALRQSGPEAYKDTHPGLSKTGILHERLQLCKILRNYSGLRIPNKGCSRNTPFKNHHKKNSDNNDSNNSNRNNHCGER